MDNAAAGPSTVIDPTLLPENPIPTEDSSTAPLLMLPSTHFYSVEFPGYVQLASVPLALQRLGGQVRVDTAFRRTGSKTGSFMEMNMRPGDAFSHPIPGDITSTNNLLLKVVKRTRKKRADGTQHATGEYTAKVVGVIPKTARFRSMADYQYQPDMGTPISKLRLSMDAMNVESILSYQVPEEKEEYTITEQSSAMDVDIDPQLMVPDTRLPSDGPRLRSNLNLPPPPLFSRQVVPHVYSYKANTASVITTVVDEDTGEERKRLINRMRWKGLGPTAINFTDKGVPDKPSALIEKYREEADQKLLQRLEEIFEERPVWTRTAIFNQFEPHEVREIINSKYLLPLVSYVFTDGPWRDTQLRLGYDPRVDPEARFYQRLYFRNTNHAIKRPSVTTRRQETRADAFQARADALNDRRSHIFDGQTPTTDTAAFQLCDLHEPMLKEMVEEGDELREECDERTGWYSPRALERIKVVLRHKFFSLNDFGFIATREECEELLDRQDNGGNSMNTALRSLRPTKHNMAKGALRPEDAFAKRLKATLDQRARHSSP